MFNFTKFEVLAQNFKIVYELEIILLLFLA
jgi:hypothetical protein